MADSVGEGRDPTAALRRRRERRARRRRRLALLLVLLALGVGAAVFGPGVVWFDRVERPTTRMTPRSVRTSKPLVRHRWRFDFSMGPILELIEQSVNLQPFDLRRPVRIPFRQGPRPRGDDILLADPAGSAPPFGGGRARPGALPGPRYAGPPAGPQFTDPDTGLPGGGPGGVDRDLTDGDEPLADPGDPIDPGDPEPQDDDPVPIPEPGLPLLAATAALGALARRRGRPQGR